MENEEKVAVTEFVDPVKVETKEDVKHNINKYREEFLQKHSAVMKKNRIASGVFFVLTIGFVILGYELPKLLGLCFGLISAGLVVIFLMNRRQRKKLDTAVAEYLYGYSLYSNSYMYDDKVTDLKIGYKLKPEVDDVKKISISDEVSVINSRDLVKGKIEGKEFIAADISLKIGNPKKEREQKALFVGKVYMLDYSFNEEGRAFLYLKGCGDASPTKLEDVNKVQVNNLKKEWEVYTSYKNYDKIFTQSLVKALNKIECNETLNDVVISIVEGKVLVGYSYSDEAMIIPMNKEYETNHLEIKKENYLSLIEINKSLLDNSNFTK